MTRPITILKAGNTVIIDGGIALIGWTIDTGGRGRPQQCLGEVLIAVRDHLNKCFDDTMKILPETAFDEERIAAAKSEANDIWRKV